MGKALQHASIGPLVWLSGGAIFLFGVLVQNLTQIPFVLCRQTPGF